MNKFFILGLPRSRTYWLSQFLQCTHDGLYYYPDYQKFLDSPSRGDSTTSYPWIKGFTEGHKKVVIERDLDECFKSSRNLFKNITREQFVSHKEELDQIKDCLRIPYDEIDNRLKEIWEYCRKEPFDEERAETLKKIRLENVQLINEVKTILNG